VSPMSRFDYPKTRTDGVTDTLFGVTTTDPFRWLEDQKTDEVQKWLGAQDAFARAKLKSVPERDAIAERLKELFFVESRGVPSKAGKRYFFSKREGQQEKSVVYWREGKTEGTERVLLDPNAWAKDGSVSLGSYEPSLDGKYVAYTKKGNNSDEATIYVVDVAMGKDSAVDVIEGAKYGGVSWAPKSDGFYYTFVPPVDGKTVTVADRPGFAEMRFHKLGDDPKKDRVVHECTRNAKTFLAGEVSRDGHFLFAYVEHGWSATDVYYKDMRKGEPKEWSPLVVGKPFKYVVYPWRDHFYVRTDEGAPNGRIFKIDPAKPARTDWKEIVPERKDATLDAFNIVGDMLSLDYLKDVQSHVEVHDLDGKLVRELTLPTVGSGSVIYGNPDEPEGYYTFTSFTHPTEIYETNVKTGVTTLHYRLKTPVDPSKFMVEQLFATSKDGTRVPYFVVRAKDFQKDGSSKALVYGYGGFLVTQKPAFTSSAYPWLERGGIYVVANLRGGGEYGEAWHQAGMGRKKQNVFDDLYAVLEKLSADGYTKSDRIAVRGASNGGLLVGAAVVQRPELFAIGLCGVPLIDMVRYHLFGSGKTWVEEYGSAEDREDFKAIYAYSPYQHVTRGTRYPSVLVLTADADDRVDPMHARKFAARLQADSAGGEVLLRVEKHSGHGGADLVSATVEKIADELAFALAETAK
ncbi:MAG TPA: prolyl oligopeptidase family serine peptidase, partial [Polyangiaceae bacterium]